MLVVTTAMGNRILRDVQKRAIVVCSTFKQRTTRDRMSTCAT